MFNSSVDVRVIEKTFLLRFLLREDKRDVFERFIVLRLREVICLGVYKDFVESIVFVVVFIGINDFDVLLCFNGIFV